MELEIEMKKMNEIGKVVKKPNESVEVIIEGGCIDLEKLIDVACGKEWTDDGAFTLESKESE